MFATGAAWAVASFQSEHRRAAGERQFGPDTSGVVGGTAWEGMRAVFRSPYLLGISAYVLILAVMVTFIYFTRLQMVAAAGDSVDFRTGLFAQMDFYTQAATLLLQLIVVGHVMKRFGVAMGLTDEDFEKEIMIYECVAHTAAIIRGSAST